MLLAATGMVSSFDTPSSLPAPPGPRSCGIALSGALHGAAAWLFAMAFGIQSARRPARPLGTSVMRTHVSTVSGAERHALDARRHPGGLAETLTWAGKFNLSWIGHVTLIRGVLPQAGQVG